MLPDVARTRSFTSATNLGLPNATLPTNVPTEALLPCPVYVRNGPMISLGDMSRIFHVGPSETQSLREKLGGTSDLTVGRMAPVRVEVWPTGAVTHPRSMLCVMTSGAHSSSRHG